MRKTIRNLEGRSEKGKVKGEREGYGLNEQ